MLDFSALPQRRTQLGTWQIALSLTTAAGGIIVLAAIAEYTLGKGAGLAVVGLACTALSAIIISWFVRSVLVRRVKTLLRGEPRSYSPGDTVVPSLRQFATDNEFEFEEYTFETDAPSELYDMFVTNKRPQDSVYIAYLITGKLETTTFKYYRLDLSEGLGGISNDPGRRGRAYAYASNGNRVDYMTILMVDHPIRPWYKGPIQADNMPNGFVLCEGQASDRETIRKMFMLVGEPVL